MYPIIDVLFLDYFLFLSFTNNTLIMTTKNVNKKA